MSVDAVPTNIKVVDPKSPRDIEDRWQSIRDLLTTVSTAADFATAQAAITTWLSQHP